MKIQSYFLALLVTLLFSVNGQAQNDYAPWEAPYIGTDTTVLYLPDAYAVYWRYGWKRETGDPMGMVIKGQFPDARYMSYNVYNEDIKMSLGSFTDFQLVADDNRPNPFNGNVEKSVASYTLYVVPEGTKIKANNVLFFPDSITNISVFLRHYVAANNILGNRPMPTIQSYNPSTMQSKSVENSIPIPVLSKQVVDDYLIPMFEGFVKKYKRNPEAVMYQLKHRGEDPLTLQEMICRQVAVNSFSHFKPNTPIEAYNFQTKGTYPNIDNHYLTMPIIRKNEEDVLLVKFKAPAYPKSTKDYPDAKVRYYSLSQGDDITYNYETLADKDFLVSQDGFIYVMIGNDEATLSQKAKTMNINFMKWRTGERMLLVYRHMLPAADYKYGTDKVPVFDNNKPEKGQEGRATIQEYAPVGMLINKDKLMSMKALPAFK